MCRYNPHWTYASCFVHGVVSYLWRVSLYFCLGGLWPSLSVLLPGHAVCLFYICLTVLWPGTNVCVSKRQRECSTVLRKGFEGLPQQLWNNENPGFSLRSIWWSGKERHCQSMSFEQIIAVIAQYVWDLYLGLSSCWKGIYGDTPLSSIHRVI